MYIFQYTFSKTVVLLLFLHLLKSFLNYFLLHSMTFSDLWHIDFTADFTNIFPGKKYKLVKTRLLE